MDDKQWDAKVKTFFQKTGEELKRAGRDMKAEAERLLSDVKDPAKQAQLKEGLKDLGQWARKTAEDVAELVESGVKKAEVAARATVDTLRKDPQPQSGSDAAPREQAPRHDTPVDMPAVEPSPPTGPAKKSIGKKKGAAAGKGKSATGGSKKSIGKKA